MRSSIIGAAALAGRALADAPESMNNPVGVVYEAVLPEKPFFPGAAIMGNVKGSITATAREDGKGVRFTVMFENLPAEGGPFTYHIHQAAAMDGNCTTTKAHLDPFGAGVAVPCNPDMPQTCEVGDLAGKHGKVDSDPYEKHYVDMYASTNMDSESYFGDLSFVLHYANSTRLTCANFSKKVIPMPTPGDEDCSETVKPPMETTITPPMSMTTSMKEYMTGTMPEGGMGGDMTRTMSGEDTMVMPPATPPPASTPSQVVEAGASFQQVSMAVLSLGVAAALFMNS